jgi:hypothetical protein
MVALLHSFLLYPSFRSLVRVLKMDWSHRVATLAGNVLDQRKLRAKNTRRILELLPLLTYVRSHLSHLTQLTSQIATYSTWKYIIIGKSRTWEHISMIGIHPHCQGYMCRQISSPWSCLNYGISSCEAIIPSSATSCRASLVSYMPSNALGPGRWARGYSKCYARRRHSRRQFSIFVIVLQKFTTTLDYLWGEIYIPCL